MIEVVEQPERMEAELLGGLRDVAQLREVGAVLRQAQAEAERHTGSQKAKRKRQKAKMAVRSCALLLPFDFHSVIVSITLPVASSTIWKRRRRGDLIGRRLLFLDAALHAIGEHRPHLRRHLVHGEAVARTPSRSLTRTTRCGPPSGRGSGSGGRCLLRRLGRCRPVRRRAAVRRGCSRLPRGLAPAGLAQRVLHPAGGAGSALARAMSMSRPGSRVLSSGASGAPSATRRSPSRCHPSSGRRSPC